MSRDARWWRNIELGLCGVCGKRPPLPGTWGGKPRRMCRDCSDWRAASVLSAQHRREGIPSRIRCSICRERGHNRATCPTRDLELEHEQGAADVS